MNRFLHTKRKTSKSWRISQRYSSNLSYFLSLPDSFSNASLVSRLCGQCSVCLPQFVLDIVACQSLHALRFLDRLFSFCSFLLIPYSYCLQRPSWTRITVSAANSLFSVFFFFHLSTSTTRQESSTLSAVRTMCSTYQREIYLKKEMKAVSHRSCDRQIIFVRPGISRIWIHYIALLNPLACLHTTTQERKKSTFIYLL